MQRYRTHIVLRSSVSGVAVCRSTLRGGVREPLRSGDSLLGVQDFTERARSALLLDPTAKGGIQPAVFDRRLSDLARLPTPRSELAGVGPRSAPPWDRAALAVARAPESPPGTLLACPIGAHGRTRRAQIVASLTVVRGEVPADAHRFRVKLATLPAPWPPTGSCPRPPLGEWPASRFPSRMTHSQAAFVAAGRRGAV